MSTLMNLLFWSGALLTLVCGAVSLVLMIRLAHLNRQIEHLLAWLGQSEEEMP